MLANTRVRAPSAKQPFPTILAAGGENRPMDSSVKTHIRFFYFLSGLFAMVGLAVCCPRQAISAQTASHPTEEGSRAVEMQKMDLRDARHEEADDPIIRVLIIECSNDGNAGQWFPGWGRLLKMARCANVAKSDDDEVPEQGRTAQVMAKANLPRKADMHVISKNRS